MPFVIYDLLSFFVTVVSIIWPLSFVHQETSAPDSQSSLCLKSCHHRRWIQYPPVQCFSQPFGLSFPDPPYLLWPFLLYSATSSHRHTLDLLINKILVFQIFDFDIEHSLHTSHLSGLLLQLHPS